MKTYPIHCVHTHITTTHTYTHTHTQPVSSESQQKAQRDSLLATLLDLLNLTPSSQEDPTSSSSPHHHHHPAPSTHLPKIQYKPGDLGLVPVAPTKGHTHSQQCSGGASTQLPPLPESSLTANKVR